MIVLIWTADYFSGFAAWASRIVRANDNAD